jgi:hypothetical protein
MSGHSAIITSWQINFVGSYDAESNFVVSQNEIRARYVNSQNSLFSGGVGLQLPKVDDEGQVVVATVQLTADQVSQIEAVLSAAMQSTPFHGADFGPAPAPPAAE